MKNEDEFFLWMARMIFLGIGNGTKQDAIAAWIKSQFAAYQAAQEAERMYQAGEAQNYAPVEELHRN